MSFKAKCIYDIGYLPNRMTLNQVINIFNEHNFVVFCSDANGNYSEKNFDTIPKVINISDDVEIKFIDLSKEDLPDFLKDELSNI